MNVRKHTHADNAAPLVGWASRFAKENVVVTSSAALRRAAAFHAIAFDRVGSSASKRNAESEKNDKEETSAKT
jgi:hypothetical protein